MIEFNTFLRSSVFLPLLVDVTWRPETQEIVVVPSADDIETSMLQLLDKVCDVLSSLRQVDG